MKKKNQYRRKTQTLLIMSASFFRWLPCRFLYFLVLELQTSRRSIEKKCLLLTSGTIIQAPKCEFICIIVLLNFFDFFFSCIIKKKFFFVSTTTKYFWGHNTKSVVLKEGLAMVCVGLDESECSAEGSSATLPGLRIKNGIQVRPLWARVCYGYPF